MDKIQNIEINNFKSIRHTEIKGCRKINLFVGPPNAGKSNILEALGGYSILNKGVLSNSYLKSFIRYNRFTDIFFNGNVKDVCSVSLNNNETGLIYHSPDLGKLLLLIHGFGKQLLNIKDIVFKRSGELYGEYKIESGRIIRRMEGLVPYDDKPVIKKYTFNTQIKLRSSKKFNLLMPFGENISNVFESEPLLRKEFNQLLSQFNMNLQFDWTKNYGDFELRKNLIDGSSVTISWNLIADTLQRLFFYKAAIYSNEKSILLFEEPEANCYEPYIMEITNAIKNDNKNNQFFVVTHSQYVIDELLRDKESRDDTNIYLVGLEEGETVVKKLNPETIKDVYESGLNVFFNYSGLWSEN